MLLSRFAGLGAGTPSWMPQPIPAQPGKHWTYNEVKQYMVSNAQALGAQAILRAQAMSAELPACPPSSFTGISGCYRTYTNGMLPPGFWQSGAGAIVGPNDLKNGRFDKSWKPSQIEREQIAYAVINRTLADLVRGYGSVVAVSTASINQLIAISKPSFNGPTFDGVHADLTTELQNFAFNPIPPTDIEMNGHGGYASWRARGGYLLSRALIQGKIKIHADTIAPDTCASILCRCDHNIPTTSYNISCVKAYYSKDGLTNDPSKSASFDEYVAIDQVADGYYHYSAIYHDPGTLSRFADAVAGILQKLANVMCQAIPYAKPMTASMMADRWVFPDGTNCQPGQTKVINGKAAACTKIATPDATKAAVAESEFLAEQWCAGWNADNTTPIGPQEPPLPAAPKNYWPWVIGGGVLVAILLARK
jgi:hypothetical protein